MIRTLALTLTLGTFALGVALPVHAQQPLPPTNVAVTVPYQFVSPLFSDNMVWQRDVAAPIWGMAGSGQRVTVTMGGKTAQATAAADGKWMTKLGPFQAGGGPQELTVKSNTQDLTIHNVLVGDVWLCSGQSNMEFGVGNVNNADAEIAASTNPQIRLLTVPRSIMLAPQKTLNASWLESNPQNIKQGAWNGFSAAAYFFGRELNKQLGVPIGLIHSSWGGTPAEAWVSEQGLAPLGDFQPALEQLAAERAGTAADTTKKIDAWYAKNDVGSAPTPGDDPGAAPWASDTLDATQWATIDVNGPWQKAGTPELANFNGILWLRRTFDVPAEAAVKEATLRFVVDDNDAVWINGQRVGASEGFLTGRAYTIPANLLRTKNNTIAMRVLDTGGAGGITNGINLEMPGQPNLDLTGEWNYKIGATLQKLPAYPARIDNNQNYSTVLYNGMLAPLTPLAIKGAIWYQGESNADRAPQYSRLLPAMIRDWRGRFTSTNADGNFPFYIVQLAGFYGPRNSVGQSNWAELRESQTFTARTLPNTAIASAVDIGEANDIHPKNKQEVGRRLALDALALTYGRKVVYSGPTYTGMKVEGNAIRITFSDAAGLAMKGDKLQGFAIAGADGRYVEADAKVDGQSVLVSSPQVPAPANVRYAWADNPIANLFNGAGLPATPFRTDTPYEALKTPPLTR